MAVTRFLRPLGLLAAAALIVPAGFALPAAATAAPANTKGSTAHWTNKVVVTEGGHRLGNPEAPIKLVEYMSYTCGHCADFARTADGAIKLAYIPSGKVSFEIRHLVRDSVDLTAALLTNCGSGDRFFANHAAIMGAFPEWMAKARATSQAQRSRWSAGTLAARNLAIASDLGFIDIMVSRGYSRPDIAACLGDVEKAARITEISRRDAEALNLPGTPSFTIGGTLLNGVHDWDSVRKELDSRF